MSHQAEYVARGYRNRRHYLECLAEDHGAPLEAVLGIASMLGPTEDFDALVTEIEDLVDSGAFD